MKQLLIGTAYVTGGILVACLVMNWYGNKKGKCMCGGKCGGSASAATTPAVAGETKGGNDAMNTLQQEVQQGTDASVAAALAADGAGKNNWYVGYKPWGKK